MYSLTTHAEYVQPGPGTAVDNVVATPSEGKIVENGYLYILLNGHRYNAQGATIK